MKHADEKRSAASARRSGAKAPDSVKHDGGTRARAAVPTRTATQTEADVPTRTDTQTRTSRKAQAKPLAGAWQLYRDDLRRARINVISMVIILGLVVIPAVFAWFNVAASWNPFGNTRNLTVAVANADTGYKSDLVPMKVNAGEQVVSALRANKQLKWEVTTPAQALEGTKSGKYYAAIVIPEGFSKNMLSFFSSSAQSTQLNYYINEKRNGIAPKIAGAGAQAVSTQVNAVFTKTVGEVVLNLTQTVSTQLSTPEATNALNTVVGRVETLSTRFDSAANLLTSYGGLVDGANGLVTSSVSLVGQGSKDAQQLRTQLGQVATETGNIKSAVANANQALQGAFNASTTALNSVNAAADQVSASSGQSVSAVVTSLNQQASGLQAQATNYQKVRDNLATLIAQLPDPTRAQGVLTSLDGIISRLNSAATSLQSAATQISNKSGDSQASITEAKNLIGQAKTELSGLKTTVDTNIAPQANQLAADLAQVSDGLGQVRESVSTSLGGSGAGSLQAKLTQMKTNLDGAAKDLSAAGAQMKTLSEKLRGAIDSGDLAQVQKIIGDDPQRLAQALTTPAVVERHPIYAVENFGSSMAPLYATVAMWMGTMLIGVVVRAQPVSNVSKLRPSQVFFGRWGIFATIGLAQATLVAGGLLLFLDVQSVHPWLFMITAWLTAIVFSLINYSFVAAFGNVGKAISILFLVMQVSGAGGSFPLAILPGFLSELSPYLPAKPVIDALRCGVAGYSGNEYLGHIGHLLLFIIPALIIGLVLRPILARRNQANSEAVESTKVLG